ncbi:MAG: ice-binding family protein [Gemmatimonadaceae bacterium]
MQFRSILASLSVVALLVTACDPHVLGAPGTVASIDVDPDVTLPVGGTQQFVAVGYDAEGRVTTISPVWAATVGGTINATGFYTAGNTPGVYNASVSATANGISGTANVTVVAGPLATITVTPNPDTTQILTTQQFVAVGRDAFNNIVPITPGWTVTNGGGAINATTGLFTAGSVAGEFLNTVRATSGSIFGTATVVVSAGALATITVTPNPDTLDVLTTSQFTAVGRDAGNNIVPITPVWSVVNGGGAIDAGGLFTAGGTGGEFLNTVRATSGSVFGSATVVILDPTPAPLIPLGTAETYGILAATEVTCSTGGFIDADIGIFPGSALTGFGPCTFTGVANLANAAAEQAQLDLIVAYDSLAGMPCPPANAIVADLGGTTKPAGVYCTASGIGVTGVLTLDGGGDPNAFFVFQAGSSLTTAGDVVLIGSAQAKNVYWLVGSSATLGTASQWQGNIIALTSITLNDTATLNGRALARNGAVTLGSNNTITLP